MSAGLQGARRQWLKSALPLVDQEVKRLGLPASRDEEMRSVALETVARCMQRFEPAREIPFSAYCRQRIRWALIDQLRRENRGLRRAHRAAREQERIESLLEVSDSVLVPQDLRDAAASAKERAQLLALEARLQSVPEQPEGRHEDPEPRTDPARLLDHLMRVACPEDRELLSALYREELTLAQYARRRGVSPSTASRRHARALRRLRSHAEMLGGASNFDRSDCEPLDPSKDRQDRT